MILDPWRNRLWSYITCLMITMQVTKVHGYKPVIILHGILDAAADLKHLENFIKKAHPGTVVYSLDVYDHYASLNPLWDQVEYIKNLTKSMMDSSEDGVHFIGYSQGGLIGRGLIQTSNEHKVNNFIALSSPLNGQFGDTSYLNALFPSTYKEKLYELFYSHYGQRWSIGNYWKDPHHKKLYGLYSSYLALLNNESLKSDFSYQNSWQRNFQRLNNVVLIGGPDDGVISPWQSAQFACYNEREDVVPMRNLQIYKDDVFGLKSLDRRGSLHECTMANVHHIYWHRTEAVFKKCIEPWLT
ncbi:unnamed protein product [Clavelina lepadiformis]|uniref:palmitoyl-CoA hydrolase n=1 Tax=Clavelina lepadiformis TaxID=159417 RepID=A0ABP0F5D2_CLALP